jgi:cell wall-associated NlpC family hydrolase
MRNYAVVAYVYGDIPAETDATLAPMSGAVDPKNGYLRAGTDNRRALIETLHASEAKVKSQIAQLEQAKATASAKADDLNNKQHAAQIAVDEQQALKNQVDSELNALIQQAERQRADAERAAAQAAQQQAAQQQQNGNPSPPASQPPVTNPSIPVRPIPPGPIPPPSVDGAAKAIAYAKAQLGKPYQWGAAGPDTFDCSGLTMMAWREGGINLLHYTGSQYAKTRPIPLSAVQPGDLVFYNDFDHVALYIGKGKIIQAPHTGATVEIQDMYFWNTTMAATRPLP